MTMFHENIDLDSYGINKAGNISMDFHMNNFTFLNFSYFSNFSYLLDKNNSEEMDGEYALPNNVRIILLCLYAITILLAVGGNGLVIYVVFRLQRMRNITNFYIANLSCSDIIVTSLCIPFTLLSNLIYYYWPFGSFLCPSIMYLQLTAVLQRALTLVVMTLDRHYAIWKPFGRRVTKSEAKCAITVIWIVSALIALPTAINTRITYLPYEPGNQGLCTEVWGNHVARYWYSINIMLLQYFIPLTIMCITYIHIGIIIWIKQPPGEADSNRDTRLAASKRKTLKMLLVVVSMYALFWLPLHLITIIGDLNPNIYNYKNIHIVWLYCHWLAISNTFSNPVIYFCMNSAFHHGFLLVFRRVVFCQKPKFQFRRPHVYTSARTAYSAKSNTSTQSNKDNQQQKGPSDMAKYELYC